jgi:hypothetical protein
LGYPGRWVGLALYRVVLARCCFLFWFHTQTQGGGVVFTSGLFSGMRCAGSRSQLSGAGGGFAGFSGTVVWFRDMGIPGFVPGFQGLLCGFVIRIFLALFRPG